MARSLGAIGIAVIAGIACDRRDLCDSTDICSLIQSTFGSATGVPLRRAVPTSADASDGNAGGARLGERRKGCAFRAIRQSVSTVAG
jgi:hypothetical protein